MPSDTATASTRSTFDDGVGVAEPASILTRLIPDDLHPARLAGPHAWHPWGLTATPPTDRHLRLILPPTSRAGPVKLLDRLETKLARTSWPPDPSLEIRRNGNRLDCRHNDTRRSLIQVAASTDGTDPGQDEVVTRGGWPILDELAALNDRIRHVNVDDPSRTDLADLASWVEHKMSEPGDMRRLAASLQQLLGDQVRRCPIATDRFRAILTHRQATATRQAPVLGFLADQLNQQQRPDRAVRR